MDYPQSAIGPRRAGMLTRSHYWRSVDEVLHVGVGAGSRIPWSEWSITVRGDDGIVRTHCTAWDARDTIVK